MKMKVLGLTGAATMATMATMAGAAPVQWTAAGGGNDHWYELIDNSVTWTAAKDAAAASTHSGEAGYLATITSVAELNFLSTSVNPNSSQAWLGGSDAAVEGEWRWVTGPEAGTLFWQGGPGGGTTVTYANWGGIEPNNNGNEDVLFGWWSGDKWADFPAGNSLRYLVEYDGLAPVPLPAGLPLLLAGVGMLGLIGRRRRR